MQHIHHIGSACSLIYCYVNMHETLTRTPLPVKLADVQLHMPKNAQHIKIPQQQFKEQIDSDGYGTSALNTFTHRANKHLLCL